MIRSNIDLFGHSAQQILCAEVETPSADIIRHPFMMTQPLPIVTS